MKPVIALTDAERNVHFRRHARLWMDYRHW